MVVAGVVPAWVTRWMSTGEKLENVTGHVAAQRRRAAQAQALLHDRPLRDDDRPRREGVIVEAGVLAGHPAAQPDLDLIVQAHALEDALAAVVADETAPTLGVGGEAGHDPAQ